MMAIPDYQSLMLPLLTLVSNEEGRIPDLAERIADNFNLSQEQRSIRVASGTKTLLIDRLHWAKTYLHKAGLVVGLRRGVFIASDAGRALLTKKPPKIDIDILK